MEDQWEAKTEKDVRDSAEQIVKDALRVLRRGTSISPHVSDCPRDRAQIAIRYIANVLFDLSEAYQLDADLMVALWDVAIGFEPALPKDLRQCWENTQFPTGHEHAPPDKTQ